jgi:hypothetical protein
MSFTVSPARLGLDGLLERYPFFELVKAEWQIDGLWLLVTLGQRGSGPHDAFAVWHFAIFISTGAVHNIKPDGMVEEVPLFEP